MGYDASIILGGRPVNALGALAAGNDLAKQSMDMRRINALEELYRTQGAGILRGDAGALNALAGHDPAAALGMQKVQQGMAFDAEQMGMAREQARIAAAQYAKTLSDEQRAAQAAKIESGLKGAAFFYQNGDRAGYEGFLAQNGLDPAEHPFDQFPAVAAQYEGVLEAYKAFKPEVPEWVPATPEQAKAHGAVSGQVNSKTGKFEADKPPSGMKIESDGQGGFTFVEGPAAVGSGKPFTEAQSKDVVFATRAEGALQVLDPVAGALTSRSDIILDQGPLGVGRDFQNREFQLARQAGDEFLQAILRKDTGAAITAPEQELYGKTFLPQPGDSQALLAQKAESRKRAVDALKAGMGPTQIIAQELALSRSGANVSPAQHSIPKPGEVVDGWRFNGGNPADPNAWEQVN